MFRCKMRPDGIQVTTFMVPLADTDLMAYTLLLICAVQVAPFPWHKRTLETLLDEYEATVAARKDGDAPSDTPPSSPAGGKVDSTSLN